MIIFIITLAIIIFPDLILIPLQILMTLILLPIIALKIVFGNIEKV